MLVEHFDTVKEESENIIEDRLSYFARSILPYLYLFSDMRTEDQAFYIQEVTNFFIDFVHELKMIYELEINNSSAQLETTDEQEE